MPFTVDELKGVGLGIAELDFSAELVADPVANEWTELGLWTVSRPTRHGRAERTVGRQCLIVPVEAFATLFCDLESIGNVLHGLGEPAQWKTGGKHPEYRYNAFHTFQIGRNDQFGEPIVYRDPRAAHDGFCINPDLPLFLKLEETSSRSGIWKDPRHGNDVLRHIPARKGEVERVEVRTSYLLQYLRARRQSLLFGHYQDCALFEPTPDEVTKFGEEGESVRGSPSSRAKVLLQNRGLKKSFAHGENFLLRRMHLWLVVDPPEIDVDDPWAKVPPFDAKTFTFPTSQGDVAPARWKHFKGGDGAKFAGVYADFMTPVFFRQEVLQKYQGASGFEVMDDGSVVCGYHWGLQRSTDRLGNELVMTAIGDFAEGVPFEEWEHWKQYVVDVPSQEDATRMRSERTIPEAVNSLDAALRNLNDAVRDRAANLGLDRVGDVWNGSLDSLAAKQMKWVYPIEAGDEQFLGRCTLTSTFVVDEIAPSTLRTVLAAFGAKLHQDNPLSLQGKTLGSRNLLQRLALACVLSDRLDCSSQELPSHIRQAETAKTDRGATDIEVELQRANTEVRAAMAPLAFVYDLRTHGGIAHPPSPESASQAAVSLGLPGKGWARRDYLHVLAALTEGVNNVAELIER